MLSAAFSRVIWVRMHSICFGVRGAGFFSGSPAATAAAEPEGASYTPVAPAESGKPRRVKDIEPGMELEGRVTSIALYGIFVDIGVGRDGLVHISEMSDTRIDSPSDIVQIGDEITVSGFRAKDGSFNASGGKVVFAKDGREVFTASAEDAVPKN